MTNDMITAEKIAFDLDCETNAFEIIECKKIHKDTFRINLKFDLIGWHFDIPPDYRLFELITTENSLYVGFIIEL
jgi:hypothetical protein